MSCYVLCICRLQLLVGNLALHRNYSKRDDGALKSSSLSLSSGASLVNTTITYDSGDKFVTGYANAIGGIKRDFTYPYDGEGKNITEIKLNDAIIKSYVYDDLDQLIRENDAQANKTYVYSYDAFGNPTNYLGWGMT